MDMTVLLVVGIVLLALVGGLSLAQRRSAVRSPALQPSPMPSPRAEPVTPPRPEGGSSPGTWHDPVLGTFTFDGGSLWSGQGELTFGTDAVQASFTAGAEGPGPEQAAVGRGAFTRDDVEPRAREAVAEALRARGVLTPAFVACSVHVGRDAAGRIVGSVDYETDQFEGDVGVVTHDAWRTLHAQLDE